MDRQHEDHDDDQHRGSRVCDGGDGSPIGDAVEIVAPPVDEHRLPEEPKADQGREAEDDGPLVQGHAAQRVVVFLHYLRHSLLNLI